MAAGPHAAWAYAVNTGHCCIQPREGARIGPVIAEPSRRASDCGGNVHCVMHRQPGVHLSVEQAERPGRVNLPNFETSSHWLVANAHILRLRLIIADTLSWVYSAKHINTADGSGGAVKEQAGTSRHALGGVIVAVNVQVPVWPFGSVAVHVTVVSPTGNVSGAAASPPGVVQTVVVLLGCSSVRATVSGVKTGPPLPTSLVKVAQVSWGGALGPATARGV